MNKELNQEAENFAEDTVKQCIKSNAHCDEGSLATGFIGGATSKYVEKQKLQFAIEQLNKLDSVLQAKVSLLLDMCDESSDKEFYSRKISGIKLAKEEIRRDIIELEQKLSEL